MYAYQVYDNSSSIRKPRRLLQTQRRFPSVVTLKAEGTKQIGDIIDWKKPWHPIMPNCCTSLPLAHLPAATNVTKRICIPLTFNSISTRNYCCSQSTPRTNSPAQKATAKMNSALEKNRLSQAWCNRCDIFLRTRKPLLGETAPEWHVFRHD